MGVEDSSSAPQSAIDRSTEVTAATLKDLGRLGEGASGEVRKVMHRPTGVIMAKKVS
jgi:mitogen-activated protein kinase kinase